MLRQEKIFNIAFINLRSISVIIINKLERLIDIYKVFSYTIIKDSHSFFSQQLKQKMYKMKNTRLSDY